MRLGPSLSIFLWEFSATRSLQFECAGKVLPVLFLTSRIAASTHSCILILSRSCSSGLSGSSRSCSSIVSCCTCSAISSLPLLPSSSSLSLSSGRTSLPSSSESSSSLDCCSAIYTKETEIQLRSFSFNDHQYKPYTEKNSYKQKEKQ